MADPNKPNLDEIMKKAQAMQEQMQKAHEELTKMEVSGESGGVKVTLNGRHECHRVSIADKAMVEKKEVLEDLIAAAITAASKEVEKASQQKMLEITKQLGMPPGTPPTEG